MTEREPKSKILPPYLRVINGTGGPEFRAQREKQEKRIIEMIGKYQDTSMRYQLKWDKSEDLHNENLSVAERATDLVVDFFSKLDDSKKSAWVGSRITCSPVKMEKDEVFILKIERPKNNSVINSIFLGIKKSESTFGGNKMWELRIDRNSDTVTVLN